MSQLLNSAPARHPAFQDREERDGQESSARHAKLWALLEALGDAGALIDPAGMLVAQRLRRAREKEQGHGGR